MRLNDDVYVLSLPMNYGGEMRPLNLSLILDQANGPTLVDAGLPGQETLIEAALAEAGVAVHDLRRIIIPTRTWITSARSTRSWRPVVRGCWRTPWRSPT